MSNITLFGHYSLVCAVNIFFAPALQGLTTCQLPYIYQAALLLRNLVHVRDLTITQNLEPVPWRT